MNMKLLGIKLIIYILAYALSSLLVAAVYSGALIQLYGVKDWRFLLEVALKSLIVPFLFGAPFE
jgi:hypothetical protein